MKKISFLVTGDELLLGDIQDTNTAVLAKRLQDLGGVIFQHIHTSDKKSEMMQAIAYLLSHSDIMITTGGLGPTSDDSTRFAIADVLGLSLSLDQFSLTHIENRLNMFGLQMNEENKQQALFPKEAIIFTNDNGSANGCYIPHGEKAIFMLPGPPRENQPMFEKFVLPQLEKLQAFQKIHRKKWLTLGFAEGEIAAIIDATVKNIPVETGYRWSYPYLEIKIITPDPTAYEKACQMIQPLLQKNIISDDGQLASQMLKEHNQQLTETIVVYEKDCLFQLNETLSDTTFIHWSEKHADEPLCFTIDYEFSTENASAQLVKIICRGYKNSECLLEDKMIVAKRGPEIKIYVKEYAAWKLCQFCEKIKD